MRLPWTYLRDPISWLLVITGVVELLLGNKLARGVPLFAGAVLILVDRARNSVSEPESKKSGLGLLERRTFSPAPVKKAVSGPRFWLVATLFATTLAVFPPHSWPVTLVLGTTGMLAVVWVAGTRTRTEEDTAGLSLAPWLIVFLALGIWEMIALAGQKSLLVSSPDSPTISALVDPILETYPGRFAGIFLWISWGRYMIRGL